MSTYTCSAASTAAASSVSENRRYWFAHETHHDAGQYRADHPLVGHRHGR